MNKEIRFRFYEELNDHLPLHRRKRTFTAVLDGPVTAGEAIERLGAPLREVDLILVNGQPAEMGRRLESGDRVAVYPVFESLDISRVTRLLGRPLRQPRFIATQDLEELAVLMRELGLDVYSCQAVENSAVAALALKERRIILTRRAELAEGKGVTHAHRVRSEIPREQLEEVLNRFDLGKEGKADRPPV